MGSIVCKAERELGDDPYTGYIAMLAVDTSYRKLGIGELYSGRAIGGKHPRGLLVSLPSSVWGRRHRVLF